jgi:uncharacterized membrane protein YccC
MKLPFWTEVVFSVKSFAAAMLAVYISMRIGLPRPFWAMMTCYIVSVPYTGPTRSKAVYRACGTVLGAVAVTFAVPQLSNSPELLSLTLALWIGVCLYVSLLDRTPRSYLLMLAGYTAALIAFPAVNAPESIFEIALARVEEIMLGIICSTVIQSLVLPQSFGPVLLERLDHAMCDAQHWIHDALKPDGDAHSASDRRRLAADITELRIMSTHLPFDTSHLRWTERAVTALHELLTQFVPIVLGIEDRLIALRGMGASMVLERWSPLLKDIIDLTGKSKGASLTAQAGALHQRIEALTPALSRELDWTGLIELNLATRLRRLLDIYVNAHTLHQLINSGVSDRPPAEVRNLPGIPPSALHRDHGLALLSAFAAVVSVLICCIFWILTGWPSGAGAPMMAAMLCCFFSTQDNPVPFIKDFLKHTIYSIPLTVIYVLVLLPAINSFEMLVLVCAPVFLTMGVLFARPSTFWRAMAFLFSMCGTLALTDSGTADLMSLINGMLSQVFGLAVAAVTTGVLRRMGAAGTARRLLKAGWSELARLGNGERVTLPEFSARMVDRVGLLTPRLALAGAQQDLEATDALRDLRIGLNMTLLEGVRARLGHADAAVAPLMNQLARHFALRPKVEAECDARLLASIDDALRAVCGHENSADDVRSEALVALTGMRRDLFPNAAPYEPALVSAIGKGLR